MLKRRAARMVVTGLLLTVPLGLTACRTSPNVAAYVGDEQITVAELEAAMDERTQDETVAAAVAADQDAFTRRVLTVLVQEQVYTEVAARYGVEVDGDDVRAEIDDLLGDGDPDTVFGDLAQQGIGRADVFESVRQRLIRRAVAEAEGRADPLGVEALRARYEEIKGDFAEYSFGYIAVPDEATATAVLAQITATPAAYPTIAAQYPGAYTLPALEERGADELPSVLAEGITTAEPGSGFATPVPETGGVVVTFVEGLVYPPFEELRPQLEATAADEVDAAAGELVTEVQDDLEITVNPRFGVLDGFRLVPDEGGVVDLLEDDDIAAEPPSSPRPGHGD
ncbi:SurA N-terminal domain-containing protein [Blastococcus sp. PRF04-17]|uniref:SurA N-terminal domain-containing protein n=1 Tax=Blastococcus sp. PRF04-17 TaxID=2933797 RepID=UPI001FF5BE5D|nr:SurA N-terminal domain-containing protein [Blastococcus sp. PRF04-17]UOX99760.1 SurA N-terminal domain-containing protein [Blastococcus sp. PRF04-17]